MRDLCCVNMGKANAEDGSVCPADIVADVFVLVDFVEHVT